MRVAHVEKVADEVTTILLEGVDGGDLPDYQPGQHLTVRLDHEETGEPIIRCYSLVGSALLNGRKSYQIAVRFVPAPLNRPDLADGKMSKIINRRLRVGDFVDVRAPKGDFVPPTNSKRPIVLVAGGIGITPFLSYLETVAKLNVTHQIHLAYGNRAGQFEAFADRIKELEKQIPTLTVSRYWSEPSGDVPNDVITGHIEISNLLRPEFLTTPEIYFCGPSPMTKGIKNKLAQAGHPTDLVYEEAFTAAAVDESSLPPGPYSVRFERSGKVVVWERSRGSILDLADSEGVRITSGCRAGQCESCEVRIVAGECKHRVEVNHPGGETCLACQAVPTSDISIDA
jgi:ferredoxin-NADP reductase